MSIVSVTVDQDGVRIPRETVEKLGLHPGDSARLQVRVISEAERIQRNGKYYCFRKLGDALGVTLPERQADVWVSDLVLRGHEGSVGRLVYSADGDVLPDRSSSKQEILELIDAPSAEAAAT